MLYIYMHALFSYLVCSLLMLIELINPQIGNLEFLKCFKHFKMQMLQSEMTAVNTMQQNSR